MWKGNVKNSISQSALILVANCFLTLAADCREISKPIKLDPGIKPNSKEAMEFCLSSHALDVEKIGCARSSLPYCVDQHTPPGETDLVDSACLLQEGSVWEEILNDRYKLLIDKISADSKRVETLRQSQRDWLKFREAFCSVVFHMEGSHAYVGFRYGDCRVLLTVEQIVNLSGVDSP